MSPSQPRRHELLKRKDEEKKQKYLKQAKEQKCISNEIKRQTYISIIGGYVQDTFVAGWFMSFTIPFSLSIEFSVIMENAPTHHRNGLQC